LQMLEFSLQAALLRRSEMIWLHPPSRQSGAG